VFPLTGRKAGKQKFYDEIFLITILANTLQEALLIVQISPETLSRRLNSTCTTSEQPIFLAFLLRKILPQASHYIR
jgi:hypothetical protein